MVLTKINPLIPTPIFSCVREYRRFLLAIIMCLEKRLLKYTIMPNNGHRQDAS